MRILSLITILIMLGCEAAPPRKSPTPEGFDGFAIPPNLHADTFSVVWQLGELGGTFTKIQAGSNCYLIFAWNGDIVMQPAECK